MDRARKESAEPSRDDPRLGRDLRAMMGDGTAFSVMVGLGETYFAAFALAAGLGDALAGWMTTLPMLAGGLLQLVTPSMVVRLDSCRRWVVLCASLQAASFAPLIAAALSGRVPAPLLFLCAALYWGAGMATGPAWNVWAETLVPIERRARFFANRSRWCQAALLAAVLAGGAVLDLGGRARAPLRTFALLFCVAAAARTISVSCLALQREPKNLVAGLRLRTPWRAWRNLSGSDAQRLLRYLLCAQTAVYVAAPFFTPYMLGPLALSYARYTILTAVAFASRIAVLPLLGRFAHARSNRSLLWFGALGIAPQPALWLLSNSYPYLIALQITSGASWAAFELSTLLAFFEELAPPERASVLAGYNLANALAISVGALLGGSWLREFGATPACYAGLFLLSSAGRLASVAALRGIAVPKPALEPARAGPDTLHPAHGALPHPMLGARPTRRRGPSDSREPRPRQP
jgi:MFS family permease